jgi:hypothetical protein
VPGSFIYAPSAGHVLAPGRHKLTAVFTPSDLEKNVPAHAAVELLVETSASAAKHHATSEWAPFTRAAVATKDAPADLVRAAVAADSFSPRITQRETRTYKGAIYEKGDDGQWHLQQK